MTKPPTAWDDEFARATLEAMVDLVLVKGPGSRLLWANAAFREYYGVTEEEFAALVLDAAHSNPDDTLQYVRDDQRVMSSGETLDVGAEAVTSATGDVSYFHTIKSPIRNAAGDIVGTVGVSRPATDEQTVASEADRTVRHTSLASLRSLVSSLPTAVAMFDATNRLASWSDRFGDLAGSNGVPELTTTAPLEAIEPALPIGDDVRHVLHTGQSERRIVDIGTQQLELHVLQWSTADDKVGGTLVNLHDVTEIMTVREQLEFANDELTQFNYRASHDLISPLASVSGMLTFVDDLIGDGEMDDVPMLIGLARTEIERLRSLVGDLMALARVDATSVDVEAIDLAELVNDVVEPLDDRIRDLGIDVRVDTDGIVVHTVTTRLRQILDNLMSNAVKFVDPSADTPTITVTARRQEGATRIDVSDNGVGVSDALAGDLFDLFVRGSASPGGHGLGLYIVKKHAQRLGGSVTLSSTSQPTTFTVELPDTNESNSS